MVISNIEIGIVTSSGIGVEKVPSSLLSSNCTPPIYPIGDKGRALADINSAAVIAIVGPTEFRPLFGSEFPCIGLGGERRVAAACVSAVTEIPASYRSMAVAARLEGDAWKGPFVGVCGSDASAILLIFEIRDAEEGGYYARALGYSIFTEADTWEELRQNVLDARSLHFEDRHMEYSGRR